MNEQNSNAVQAVIEQLKTDGYRVRFTHWRQTYWDESKRYSRKLGWLLGKDKILGATEDVWRRWPEWDYGQPMSNGGKTRCSIIRTNPDDTEDLFLEVITHCRSTEQFCYAQGRRAALDMVLSQICDVIPELDRDVYKHLREEICRAKSLYWKQKRIKCVGNMKLSASV